MKQTIIFGGGCFWCTEAIFKRVEDINVESGYAGGKTNNPTYEQVCSGKTEHAEAIRIGFDDKKISLIYLLDLFFKSHDPTTQNKQGNDIGTQYRSIILYSNEQHKKIILNFIKEKQKELKDKIVTEVKKLENFYPAEKDHQNYYENNKNQSYCKFVILPKLEKFKDL